MVQVILVLKHSHKCRIDKLISVGLISHLRQASLSQPALSLKALTRQVHPYSRALC